jgi:periplasmic protein CpxP/Spy
MQTSMTKVMLKIMTFFKCLFRVCLTKMMLSTNTESSFQAMKLKNLSIFASIVAIGLSATSFAVKAQPLTSKSLLVAQEQPVKKPRGDRFAEQLGLDNDQKARIEAIMKDTHAKMDAVLTPAQRTQKQEAQQNRQAGKRGNWKALNLSQDQKNDMKRIREASKAQIQDVLRPDQKQKWEQLRQQKRDRRQQTPRPNTSPS